MAEKQWKRLIKITTGSKSDQESQGFWQVNCVTANQQFFKDGLNKYEKTYNGKVLIPIFPIHHKKRYFLIFWELNLRLWHWVNFHNIIWESKIIKCSSHFTAVWAWLKLVEGELLLSYINNSRHLEQKANIKKATKKIKNTNT